MIMKKITLTTALLCIATAPAFAQNNVEAETIKKAFAGYHVAEAYHEHCDKDDSVSDNLKGHVKMISARLSEMALAENPNLSPENALQALRQIAAQIKGKTESVLKEKGCDSKEAASAKKAYDFFSSTSPGDFEKQLNKDIVEKGGKITQ